jgi:asparagine synthase (glutamine-hydrolysing)
MQATLARMTKQLARRGPDDDGFYFDGPLGFGHRRLAIIDLTERSHQPMVDKALQLAIVFNGAIYNYKQLRAELQAQGYRFFSEGDTEVILKAYAEWGERCVDRLHGMFAFAVWNSARQTLFLARDRMGIKPLYFSRTGKQFRFASTPQALLVAGDVDTRIDPVALHHQLTLHAVVPAPHTILQGIRKLAPATTLTVDVQGGATVRRYWQLNAQRPAQEKSEQDWIEAVHQSLRGSV